MSILSLIILSIALSIDSLAASISTGACNYKISKLQVLKVGFVMALFQGAMPVMGWLIGVSFRPVIEAYDHWVAFLLLLLIGGKLIYDGLTDNIEAESKNAKPKTGLLFLSGMAIATSIDALAVGVGFGLIQVNIWFAIGIIAITTFIFSTLGVELGKRIGTNFNMPIEIFGGLLLIGIGTKILIEHIFIIHL